MDRSAVIAKPPGKLVQREPEQSDAQYEGNPREVPEGQESGFCRDGTIGERGEKDAQFDEDGTKLMPDLNRIFKFGHVVPREKLAGEYGNQDIEDLDAGYQSFFNQPLTQRKTESDISPRNSGVGTGEPGDLPVTDSGDGEDDNSAPSSKGGRVKTAYELQGHTEFQGLPIAIENRAGTVRSGVDKDGHKWRTKMKLDYGYLEGTKGADGDGVDCYVGPEEDADKAYVVHQKDPETGSYDEDKIFLGLRSKKDAREAFMAHYDDPEKFLGPISEVPMQRLGKLVEAKKELVKISGAHRAYLYKALIKQAQDSVLGMGPEPAPPSYPSAQQFFQAQQSQQPSPFAEARSEIGDARKAVNLARKLWEARSAVPMLI